MRYPFKIDPLMQVALLPFGANADSCYAEFDGAFLHIKMGKLFDEKLPLEHMLSASPGKWSLLQGLGVRMGFHGEYGVIASLKNVVTIDFKGHEFIKALGPMHFKAQKLVLALEDPVAFIEDLNQRLALT